MKTKDIFSGWNRFLCEGSHKPKELGDSLLREIDQDEMSSIQGVLDEMDGDVLAFDKLFNGKNRIILPFSSLDFDSDVGKFMKLMRRFADLGWEADYKTGTISRDKKLTDKQAMDLLFSRNPKPAPKKTVKIGKFLSSLAKMAGAIVSDLKNTEGKNKEELLKRSEKQFILTGGLTKRAISFLFDIPDYTGNVNEIALYEEAIKQFQEAARVWQQQAEVIKKGGKKEDIYSIILTRHPIDVLRMSDFEEIQSCHSPPSRGGAGEFYKCAVAEAHGHGALAYLVENEDLEENFEEPIEKLENNSDFQDEEIFLDDERDVGGVTPINRVRLRQLRYYPTTEDAIDASRSEKGNPDIGGTEVAVVEQRVYGAPKVPGFRQAVLQWAQENQEEVIADIPKFGKSVKGPNFVKFGGSYEDFGTRFLLKDLVGVNVAGDIYQNTKTQDQLEHSVLFTSLEREFRESIQRYESGFEYFNIDIDFEDGFVSPTISLIYSWDIDDWEELPAARQLSWIGDEFNDYGEPYGFFKPSSSIVQRTDDKVYLTLDVDAIKMAEMLSDYTAFYDPHEFEGFLARAYQAENGIFEGIKEIITTMLKREGYFVGASFYKFANKVEMGDISPYEWDLTVDGEEPDYYEVSAKVTIYDVPTGAIGGETLKTIVSSRDFLIELRKLMLAKPRQVAEEEYYLTLSVVPSDITDKPEGNTFDLRIDTSVNEDHPKGMLSVFEALVEEMDDEDELRQIIETAFRNVATEAIKGKQNISEQKLFNNWRAFLNG